MPDLLPILLYIFATLTLPVWNWFAHTVQWGNAQELITWIVAGFALVFARKAAQAAGRTNELQDEQIKQLRTDQLQRDDEKHREQAEKVAVWCDAKQLPSRRRPGTFLDRSRVIQIRNSSELPVFVATIYVTAPMYDTIDVIEPDIPVPPASEPRALVINLDKIPHENRSRPLLAGIYFRDARNHFWHRGADGVLHGLTEDQFFRDVDTLRIRFDGSVARPNEFDD